jgi:formylglycine-generating enzyme required for sulfatase activity
MNRFSKNLTAAGLAALVLTGCQKSPSHPTDPSARFKFSFEYGAESKPDFLFRKNTDASMPHRAKAVRLEAFDMVRVMIVDYSAYASWESVLASPLWREYSQAMQNWTGNRDNWDEWIKFISDYMSIVADQILDIRGQEAVGTVAGVKGLNRIIVGLMKNNVMQYVGEGDGYGVEGETQQVRITVIPWSNTGGGGGNGQQTVSYVVLKPDSTLLFNNQTKQFKCIVHYTDYDVDTLTSGASWSLSPGTLGTINSAGLFQAGSAGDGYEKVIVSAGGKKDTAKVKLIKGSPGDMILIPAGSFTMGKSTPATADWAPAHTVTLNAYHIDRFEVTCAQYVAFLNAALATGSVQVSAGNAVKDGKVLVKASYHFQVEYTNGSFKVKPEFENKPMTEISWWGADAYTKHYGKRLPTEAEWEKAARGTDAREYPWGNATATGYYYNYLYMLSPIGQFHPQGDSPYGLSDVAGNAYEWVNDWYGNTYYASSPSANPQGPTTGTEKVARGGSVVYCAANFILCYDRTKYLPDNMYGDRGFRCAKNP